MTETQSYDDRLTGHDDPDRIVKRGSIIAEEMAERHYPECYETPPCKGCMKDTPAEDERTTWAKYHAELEELCDAVVAELADLEAEPRKTPRPWVRGAYHDGFRQAAVAPSDCQVCPDGR